jgi:hypothetical protein
MSHHDNIQMLRALGNALGDNAAQRVRLGSEHDSKPTVAEQAARLIICDLAAACMAAAGDIEQQHRDLVARFTGTEAERASSDA